MLFLYDVLRVLGISKEEARRMDYTFNRRTGEELSAIARHQNISHEMRMLIINHKW